ncbi:zinc-binding alcohol dehydrogenase family protein [Mesorhizobium sp. STM 4661]|uniref:quinone oxidoreductase family protein n=1 Tax=Mesorhizobium sp. STM 4661 TaxID=1297570 RepID=UPI0002BE3303|nr:zinc-binding alcohol dehydrogenase family protein [Mesorhizobium sp. STM 4661]CCV13946.1 putative NADPH:quinone reductase [Mesorhizobium sp. STM 4661]
MKAAVVNHFGEPPEYGDFREPEASDGETIIRVHAAPLSPIVRGLAAGKHYASGANAGFVPGVDGVGTDPDGRRVYFLFPKAPFGSMGEMSLVSNDMVVPIPDDISDVRAAAVTTGGLASWIALTRRTPLHKGSTVLINGATGAAGGMAIQIARHFGATRIIGVGRNLHKLSELNLEARIKLDDAADDALREEFDRGVDVVLDFIWGEPASRVIAAATKNRGSRIGEPRVRYVQLGTVAGDEISLRGDSLRSTGLELLGSGIGSVAVRDLLAGAGELIAATQRAGFDAPVTTLPLTAVGEAWAGSPDVRYVLSPAGYTR